MKVLVLGASGATGRQVVLQLLCRGIPVKLVVRPGAALPEEIRANGLVELVTGNIAEFDPEANLRLVEDCDALVSCLGHNITFKGLFGQPRLLVRQALKNACEAAERLSDKKVKVVLMNTVANEDRDIGERRSRAERLVLSILYFVLPPHKDNVRAAEYLRKEIGTTHPKIEWTAVRPDSLIDGAVVSRYEVFEAIQRSPLFDPGKTSRINVGHFMADLLTKDDLWLKWKGKMPVIYNAPE